MPSNVALLRPIDVGTLETLFPERPHPLPPRHRYFLYSVDGVPLGYTGFGYGLQQQKMLKMLFTTPMTVGDSYEITRSYCRRGYPNAPSRMLGIALRMMRKHTKRRMIYTTGAGFQGLTGRIYQASNFIYAGAFWSYMYFVPGVGYVHPRSITHRYRTSALKVLARIFPGIRRRDAPIFRYVYLLRDEAALMSTAVFKREPYPDRDLLQIMETFPDGKKNWISARDAYAPIATMRTRSGVYPKTKSSVGRSTGRTTAVHAGDGGSNPTPTLQ